jgi:hypothetical protein
MKGGTYNKKTLISLWEDEQFIKDLIITATQLKRLHDWTGHRLTEVL